MRKKLYICATYYHTLITILKTLKSSDESSLILQNTIPDVEKFAKRVKKFNLFKEISIYDEVGLAKKFCEQNIEYIYFRKEELIHLVEQKCNIPFQKYDDIYIYNDWTTLGAYLMDKKIKYHLIEDGLDTFHFLKEFLERINPKPKTNNFHQKIKLFWKKEKDAFSKRFLHRGYYYFGQSKYAIDIEVNNKSIVSLKHKKVKEVPRQQLFEFLTEKEKMFIYDIFVEKDLHLNTNKKKLILLTQPLYKDKLVSSEDIQKKVYQDIIEKFQKEYVIYLKPHPRDLIDYHFGKDIFLINKNIPTEVLSFNDDFKFNKAITISSGGIHAIKAEEKIQYGLEYLDSYKKEAHL